MTKPEKSGLDCFPFDAGFFSEKEVKRLHAKFGNSGVTVYIYLLCKIYQNGYYIKYDDDLVLDVSSKMDIPENAARQIMRYLLSRSMFDSTLAKSVKVLTAESIQRRYLKAKSASGNAAEVEGRYCLLKKGELGTSLEVHPEDGFSDEKPVKSGKKGAKKNKINTSKYSTSTNTILTSTSTNKNQIEKLSTTSTTSTTSAIPTFEEIAAFIQQIGGGVDAVKFYNTYTAQDWKTKKGEPVTDWKSLVRNWQRTERRYTACSNETHKKKQIPEDPKAEVYKSLVYNIKE